MLAHKAVAGRNYLRNKTLKKGNESNMQKRGGSETNIVTDESIIIFIRESVHNIMVYMDDAHDHIHECTHSIPYLSPY